MPYRGHEFSRRAACRDLAHAHPPRHKGQSTAEELRREGRSKGKQLEATDVVRASGGGAGSGGGEGGAGGGGGEGCGGSEGGSRNEGGGRGGGGGGGGGAE